MTKKTTKKTTIKPIKSRIAKWVHALRTTRLKQGTNYLRHDGRYCCLGIACNVFKEETGRGRWKKAPDSYDDKASSFSVDCEQAEGQLPDTVRQWFGFASENPQLDGPLTAVSANDIHRLTFAEIADLVSKRYLRVARGGKKGKKK